MLTDYQRYRLYEILPGLSIWLTLILSLILSFYRPLLMIYFIIVFDIYWVIKVINFSFWLLVAWRRYNKVKKINWFKKLFKETTDWQSKRHLIFLTLYNEDWSVVQTSLRSLARAVYDKDKFIIIIAGEERKKENFNKIFSLAKKHFNKDFKKIIGTLHPKDLSGEIPGKGSNLHYAEKEVKKYVDKKGWNYEDLITTIFDIDTVTHRYYFAYLTYLYCHHPDPTHSSYQPIALYNNNMWESPSVLRIMAFGTTFWVFSTLAKQDTLVTFSSHSLSFKTIVDVGFHEKRIVSEDSRIFYQALLHYNGHYQVTPMYIPVSMDTVRDDNWWQSIKNLYKQQRRWAWGVEHIPFLLYEFKKKGSQINLWTKIKWIYVEWEGKWSWCLTALLITILGRLPLYLAHDSLKQSALYFNTPYLLENLMALAMVGMFISAILSFPLLPQRPYTHSKYKYIIMFFQWLLLPISLIFVSAIPAIDAVTHLMLGKYLGFNVSQKKRQLTS